MDVRVFQETKPTEGIFSRFLEGYKVVAKPVPSRHQGGVTIFFWGFPVFEVKVIRQFGANVIACQLATGERRWYIVVCYLEPGDGTTIRDVEAAMAEKPRGTEMIVEGDLKVELGKKGSRGRDKDITVEVATAGLEDMSGHHFLPRRRV